MSSILTMMSLRVTALLFALAITGVAAGADGDPPARVGRLSVVEGNVFVQASEAGAPEPAQVNLPLTVSDRLMTDPGSRAEFTIGTAAVRLDEHTDITVSNLDADIAQFGLNSGTLGVHVRELNQGETLEIDTPNAAIQIMAPGDYRIEADSQGATVLSVRSGDADLDGGNGPIRVQSGQQVRFEGNNQYANVEDIAPLDEFDQWCYDREGMYADNQSSRYVNHDVVGYEDLDQYGSWYSDSSYGWVWYPHVTIVGWAPYHWGHWIWIRPWGWTWMDNSPWGFAPFHYGRWAHNPRGWCWVPGPKHHNAVWSPAHVAWSRTPRSGNGGPIHSDVSWTPLGPREVFVPGFQASPRYLRNVNLANTTIPNNSMITNAANGRVRNVLHANRDAPNAVSSLPLERFASRRGTAQREWTSNFENARRDPPSRLLPAPNGQNSSNAQNDQRRSIPRMPTDRRTIDSNPNSRWSRNRDDGRSDERVAEDRPRVDPRSGSIVPAGGTIYHGIGVGGDDRRGWNNGSSGWRSNNGGSSYGSMRGGENNNSYNGSGGGGRSGNSNAGNSGGGNGNSGNSSSGGGRGGGSGNSSNNGGGHGGNGSSGNSRGSGNNGGYGFGHSQGLNSNRP